jgi:hypothetical protein
VARAATNSSPAALNATSRGMGMSMDEAAMSV